MITFRFCSALWTSGKTVIDYHREEVAESEKGGSDETCGTVSGGG
jgi:hypothetical protein